MDALPLILKTIKEFMDQFQLKKNNIPPICGKPTFTLCQPLIDAIKKNLINMTDDWDVIYGKLHCLEDTSQLPHGPLAQVVPSSNQGQLAPFLPPTTNREQHNYVSTHHENQKKMVRGFECRRSMQESHHLDH